jgi:RNA polymerase sigma-54 factor
MNGSFASIMALSANLYLRQSQSLVMTPQLMQSIQLLQMTHFELTQFIAQEVEKNPLLEFPSNDAETGSDRASDEDDARARQADDQGSDEDYDSRSEVMSGDWSDRTDSAGAGRMNDELDANYANVFPMMACRSAPMRRS